MRSPLADLLRPKTLDDVVGQRHLLSPGGILRRIAGSGQIPNMIFYGPSGVGKTTVASIIAKSAGMEMRKLNGTTASTSDIKEIIAQLGTFTGLNGVLLYLDEIQYLNKKQQQSLLEFIEDGRITLIASTTENPYFYIYNAILSRATVFEFKPVPNEEVEKAVRRAFEAESSRLGCEIELPDGVEKYLALTCGGDVRKSINAVELLCLSSARGEDGRLHIVMEDARMVSQRSSMKYDRDGGEHYDILSALQKSIRGSDENAALHYLARLLKAGDLVSVCRRLLVIASEDIGLAYPLAPVITKACADTAVQLGLPEARIPLAQAVIMLATAPKSNSANRAIDAALTDIDAGRSGEIPPHLRDSHYKSAAKLSHGIGYKFPHDYPNHYVEQQYLPDNLKDTVYYEFGMNKQEQAAKDYRNRIKAENGKNK